eukprot:TRINITY_DN24078_c0_g1_i1.p1 TRINITY_DN24078_c0_g1~~TRINITY_DN24078_c0_g1_i1.p1  ORF type:complete len:349 (-),score=14.91 TRINITY_DN24078_c0_g1_i1:15-1061(-)
MYTLVSHPYDMWPCPIAPTHTPEPDWWPRPTQAPPEPPPLLLVNNPNPSSESSTTVTSQALPITVSQEVPASDVPTACSVDPATQQPKRYCLWITLICVSGLLAGAEFVLGMIMVVSSYEDAEACCFPAAFESMYEEELASIGMQTNCSLCSWHCSWPEKMAVSADLQPTLGCCSQCPTDDDAFEASCAAVVGRGLTGGLCENSCTSASGPSTGVTYAGTPLLAFPLFDLVLILFSIFSDGPTWEGKSRKTMTTKNRVIHSITSGCVIALDVALVLTLAILVPHLTLTDPMIVGEVDNCDSHWKQVVQPKHHIVTLAIIDLVTSIVNWVVAVVLEFLYQGAARLRQRG